MHKMALNFTNSNFVGILVFSKRSGSVHFRLWEQELNTLVWDAHSGLIPTTHVPVWLNLNGYRPALNQSISQTNRIFAQVSQTNWDIYYYKIKTTKTLGMFTFGKRGIYHACRIRICFR